MARKPVHGEVVLGLDLGTASSKAVLVTPGGEVVAQAVREHALSLPRPGWAEHDAEAIWWAEACSLLRELTAQAPGPVAAVGVSGIGPCVVPCDADDRPLRPAILYGIDTRATAEGAELEARLGADAILHRGGSALTSQALGPKLLWLARHEPAVWEATRRWHMASSFVVARLTGEWVLDHHSASQCDPLYDLGAERWNAEWAEALLPGLPLPPLAWPADVAGTVHAAGAAATGLRPGTPVVAGTIDAWAEALSAGVRRPGELMVMYGSTAFLVRVVDHPQPEPTIWTTCGIDPGSRTAAAGTATAGSLAAWLRELVGAPPWAELERAAAALPAGAEGLLVLPYFAGERTPIDDPQARGVIAGLTLRHGAGHLYRAVLEGTALGVRAIVEAMPGGPPLRTVAVGGGTGSALWPQLVSDVCGLPQEVPEVTVGASYGDARLAAEAAGLAEPGGTWARPARTIEPDPARSAVYDELHDAFRALYRSTRDVVHGLAAS